MTHLPSKEELRATFLYDQDTGSIIRRETGEAAFTKPDKDGYLRGKYRGKLYRAHRICWMMVHGEEPPMIDHINGNPSDNRIANLRTCEPKDNQRNRAASRNNASGVNGVHFHTRSQRWRATGWVDGKRKSLGQFKSLEDAATARAAFEAQRGYSERHGSKKFQVFK